MTSQIIIAGFGGQGVMSIGKLLAEAAMIENKHSSWLPSYGPEMRGGTANCHVVISDQPIISPIVTEPTDLIAMNQPSYMKFKDDVVEGGHIFINHALFDVEERNKKIHLIKGESTRSNMVMLGAFIEKSKALHHQTLLTLIKNQYTGSALEQNLEAYQQGQSLFL